MPDHRRNNLFFYLAKMEVFTFKVFNKLIHLIQHFTTFKPFSFLIFTTFSVAYCFDFGRFCTKIVVPFCAK